MGIRPFNLHQDLNTMNTVMSAAFQYPENPEWSIDKDDAEGMADMIKSLKRLMPLIRLMQVAWRPAQDLLLGYFWQEDGKEVGLCNVSRRGSSDIWTISNVAVLPEYRRRGLARKLVDACIHLAKERGAKQILLDVIQGNTPAIELYQDLGFTIFSGRFDFEYVGEGTTEPLPSNIHLEPMQLKHWQARYQFHKRITPADVQVYEPVKEATFKMPIFMPYLEKAIKRAMKVHDARYWVMNGSAEPVGLAVYMARQNARGKNSIMLKVDNNHPELRLPLLNYLTTELRKINTTQTIELTVPTWQYSDDITRAGFKQTVGYHSMGILVE